MLTIILILYVWLYNYDTVADCIYCSVSFRILYRIQDMAVNIPDVAKIHLVPLVRDARWRSIRNVVIRHIIAERKWEERKN